jgi:hypothetical protein
LVKEEAKQKESLSEKILRIARDESSRHKVLEEMRSTVYNITDKDMDQRFNI